MGRERTSGEKSQVRIRRQRSWKKKLGRSVSRVGKAPGGQVQKRLNVRNATYLLSVI